MRFPRVAFVDQPSQDAAVRFDFNAEGELNDDDNAPDADAFSLGSPSLTGNPDAVHPQYGIRQLSFNLTIQGSKATATARMNDLAGELLRRHNWLLFQLSAFSLPVWFRTYRTGPEEMSLEQVYDDSDGSRDRYKIGIRLDAEPFAYGELQTIGPVTVNNDPASGTNPLTYVLPDILGDAPAPLSLALKPSAALNAVTFGIGVVASSETGAWGASESVQFKQFGSSDGGTAGVGTTSTVTGTSYSNGSARTIDFSSSASTLATRYNTTLTWGAGTFKVLVRLFASDDTTSFGIKGKVVKEFGTEQVVVVKQTASWFDLGEVSVPYGQPTDVPLSETLSTTSATFQFMARQVSGSGTLTIDAMMLVPIELAKGSEARWLAASFSGATTPSSTSYVYVNAEAERVAQMTALPTATHAYLDTDVACRGQCPSVWPGRANTLVLAQALYGALNSGDVISRSTSVVGYYFPRYLYLAGV